MSVLLFKIKVSDPDSRLEGKMLSYYHDDYVIIDSMLYRLRPKIDTVLTNFIIQPMFRTIVHNFTVYRDELVPLDNDIQIQQLYQMVKSYKSLYMYEDQKKRLNDMTEDIRDAYGL